MPFKSDARGNTEKKKGGKSTTCSSKVGISIAVEKSLEEVTDGSMFWTLDPEFVPELHRGVVDRFTADLTRRLLSIPDPPGSPCGASLAAEDKAGKFDTAENEFSKLCFKELTPYIYMTWILSFQRRRTYFVFFFLPRCIEFGVSLERPCSLKMTF